MARMGRGRLLSKRGHLIGQNRANFKGAGIGLGLHAARNTLAALMLLGGAGAAMAQSAGQSDIGQNLENTRQNLEQQSIERDIGAASTSDAIGERTERLRLNQELAPRPLIGEPRPPGLPQ